MIIMTYKPNLDSHYIKVCREAAAASKRAKQIHDAQMETLYDDGNGILRIGQDRYHEKRDDLNRDLLQTYAIGAKAIESEFISFCKRAGEATEVTAERLRAIGDDKTLLDCDLVANPQQLMDVFSRHADNIVFARMAASYIDRHGWNDDCTVNFGAVKQIDKVRQVFFDYAYTAVINPDAYAAFCLANDEWCSQFDVNAENVQE